MSNESNSNSRGDIIGCFVWVIIIAVIIYFSCSKDYYISGDTVITRNRITKKLGYIEIKEGPVKKDYLFFWNYEYKETDIPCTILVIDRYKQTANYVKQKECVKKVEEMKRRGLKRQEEKKYNGKDPLNLFDNGKKLAY